MKNNYIVNHNWGSFESEQTINKINLRNKEDFYTYLESVLPIIFDANIKIGENITLKLKDGKEYKINIKIEK